MEREHLVRRHPPGKAEELREVPERLPRGQRPGGRAGDLRAAPRRPNEPAGDLDQRGLARPVRAEQAYELPRLDREVDARERLDPPVALLEARDGEDGRHGPSLPAPCSLFDA